MPGPMSSDFKLFKEKYLCPVKNCNAKPRGDTISKQLQTALIESLFGSLAPIKDKTVSYTGHLSATR